MHFCLALDNATISSKLNCQETYNNIKEAAGSTVSDKYLLLYVTTIFFILYMLGQWGRVGKNKPFLTKNTQTMWENVLWLVMCKLLKINNY